MSMNTTHPEIAPLTIDLRSHPLDPRRIGTNGLVARLEKLFVAAVDDPEIATSYDFMTRELVGAGNHQILVRVS